MVPRLGTSHVYLSFVFDLVATSHPVQVPFPFFWTMVFPFTFSFPIFPFSFQRESNQENISFSRSIESFTSKIKLIVGPKIWLFILTHLYYYSFLDFIASLSLILDLFSLHIKRKKKGLFLNSQWIINFFSYSSIFFLYSQWIHDRLVNYCCALSCILQEGKARALWSLLDGGTHGGFLPILDYKIIELNVGLKILFFLSNFKINNNDYC